MTMTFPLGAGMVFTVTSPADSGTGTLREAILQANATPNVAGNDRIAFALPGTGVHSIAPATSLPSITEAVDIDGTTQPGFNGQPLIELNGANAGSTASGLTLLTSGCSIRGLGINRFRNYGVNLQGYGGHVIQGNYVGVDLPGTSALGNVNVGILVFRSGNNQIGGTHSADRNVISGNVGAGIYLYDNSSRSNRVEGNFIGLDAAGTHALGNRTNGIIIYNAPYNRIGGSAPGQGNVISGNQQKGIELFDDFGGATGNIIQGNYIGTDLTGTTALPNTSDGIGLLNGQNVTVGGTNAGAGNLISGNGERGLLISGANARNNAVQGNLIGTDVTGRLALGNHYNGVAIDMGSSNLIGGNLAAARNVVSANHQSGVLIVASNATGNRVAGNFIGVDVSGTNALGNFFAGVTIEGARNNEIGGTDSGVRNVISGNKYQGVYVANAAASGNIVAGNYIGTDATGTQALPNEDTGIRLESAGNRIGGAAPAARNVISGNALDGVFLFGGTAVSNQIQGNFIGTEATGTKALANGRDGVRIWEASANLIGGAAPNFGNVIAANRDGGIFITNFACCNQIQGNRIGVDVTGTKDLGHPSTEGIYIQRSSSNQIGGAVAELGNQIAGSNWWGIRMVNATRNTVENNWIGTASDGVSDLGNLYFGIDLEANSFHNIIGGAGRGNRIAFAKNYAGVRVRDGSANNAILDNEIFGNTTVGIDISDPRVSANDNCDADTGGNLRQNYPVLATVYSGSDTLVAGSLNSAPNKLYRLQFFANPDCDSLGYGEGAIFLGETAVATAGDCNADFAVTVPHGVPLGYSITATATDPDDNTSEFSACVAVSLTAELTLMRPAPGLMQLTWPASVSPSQLQQTADLTPPIQWGPASDVPITLANGKYTAMIGATNGPRYFRLSWQPAP